MSATRHCKKDALLLLHLCLCMCLPSSPPRGLGLSSTSREVACEGVVSRASLTAAITSYMVQMKVYSRTPTSCQDNNVQDKDVMSTNKRIYVKCVVMRDGRCVRSEAEHITQHSHLQLTSYLHINHHHRNVQSH